MTAGISLILRKPGAHSAPLQQHPGPVLQHALLECCATRVNIDEKITDLLGFVAPNITSTLPPVLRRLAFDRRRTARRSQRCPCTAAESRRRQCRSARWVYRTAACRQS